MKKKIIFWSVVTLFYIGVITYRGYCIHRNCEAEIMSTERTDMDIEMTLSKYGFEFDFMHRANIVDYFIRGIQN
jgi:hypothetical protein